MESILQFVGNPVGSITSIAIVSVGVVATAVGLTVSPTLGMILGIVDIIFGIGTVWKILLSIRRSRKS